MGLFSRFESKAEDIVEGAGSGGRGGIEPVKLAKRAAKEMERGKMTGVGHEYAPTLYNILVSTADDDRMSGYYPSLAGEVETYLQSRAEDAGITFDCPPLVRFIADDTLKRGRFDIIAESVSPAIIDELRHEEMVRYGLEKEPASRPASRPSSRPPAPGEAGFDPFAPSTSPAAPPSGYAALGNDQPAPVPAPAARPPVNSSVPPAAPPVWGDDPLPAVPAPQSAAAQPPASDQQAAAPQFVAVQPAVPRPAAPAPQPAAPQPVAPDPQSAVPAPDSDLGHAYPPGRQEIAMRQAARQAADPLAAGAPQAAAPQVADPPAAAPSASAVPAAVPAGRTVILGSASASAMTPVALVDRTSGVRFDITSERTVLGRETDCGVCISDASVSRHHAELLRAGSGWLVRDLGSTNGMEVNGVKTRESLVRSGDVITLGTARLEFVEG